MKFDIKSPPRRFKVGNSIQFELMDCGDLHLDPDEQVTLKTEAGAEYDVTRKDWGFYATPSLNGRLTQFGLRAVLIKNRGTGRYFVLLVERGQESGFDAYCQQENLAVVTWMDTTEALNGVEHALGRTGA
ncbi:MAG: hypothetical protein ACK4FK_16495 [Ferrovibrio sp.]|uniref:hypothetical protein n=1 Tax=Ferrovibrio sp. TaxID=1917215 RepID=UPI00391C1C3F